MKDAAENQQEVLIIYKTGEVTTGRQWTESKKSYAELESDSNSSTGLEHETSLQTMVPTRD